MSNYSAGRGPRPADPHPRLRLAALSAVILGVVLVAAAAFVLSYAGIHQIALRAGVAPGLARLYPLIFDAMLVIAGAAALALRGAGWWARTYAWFALLLLLAAVATGNAVHATNVALPAQPTQAAVAVTPWVLLLLAFGLWLEMLRHFRRVRAANAVRGRAPRQAATAADAAAGQAANGETGPGAGNGDSGAGGAVQRTAVTWASGGTGTGRSLPRPRAELDTLLGPREGPPPAKTAAGPGAGPATEENPQQPGRHAADAYPDPVSYGEETGYVHPESHRDHADYPGQGSPAGHKGYAGPADYPGHGNYPGQDYPGQDHPGHGNYPAQDNPGHGDHPGQWQLPPGADFEGRTEPAGYAEPASPAAALDDGASGEPAAPGTGPGASRPDATPAAGPDAAPPAGAGSPPVAENSRGSTAEPGPAGEQDSPGPGDDAPQTPAPAANPWLERMRSTPAPPEE